VNFHRALGGNGNEAATALRAAQLEALKRSAPFNHPFYWSAFVVVGDSLLVRSSHKSSFGTS